MNSLQIKNWLSTIKNDLTNGLPFMGGHNDQGRLAFIQELELFVINIEEMSKHIEVLDQKIEELEEFVSKPAKKTLKSKSVENGYMQTILVKISILKNIIKQEEKEYYIFLIKMVVIFSNLVLKIYIMNYMIY